MAGMGISIAVAMIVPLLLGVAVDAFLHTSPFGVLVGLLVGITASCYTAVAQLRPYV
jgi:F0F1-type ATP synthase assembly protein I